MTYNHPFWDAPTQADEQAACLGTAAAYAKFPDDETKLFYALSIPATIEEGSP